MKNKIIRRLKAILLLASVVAITTCQLEAAELNLFGTNMPPLDFHGFISQGFLATTKYNYLADNTKDGSFQFTEAGLNVSMNPFPRTRITAQAFTYDIGDVGKYDLVLDYASIQYTFNDKVGIRAGRIRRPQGIYNDIQDVDLARTSVLLPQGVYDARYRDFYASLDGGDVFGDFDLNKAGDLAYDFYAGVIHPSMDGGVASAIRNMLQTQSTPPFFSLQLDSMNSPAITGGQLWYNTPLNGLRFGAGGFYTHDFTVTATASGLSPGGPFSSTSTSAYDIALVQGSAEYRWKQWTFQSEYDYFNQVEHNGPTLKSDSWYVSAEYRFNKWFAAGTYYNEYYNDINQRNNSLLYQKDAALSLRFDPTSWWVFKVEGHYIRGTGLLNDNADNPLAQQNADGWFMLAVKTTFSF
jgi:hypothetical protein